MTKPRDFANYARVSELLDYDPLTGLFMWKLVGGQGRKDNRSAGSFSAGRIIITIDGKHYRAHRIAWLLTHKMWPDGEIDHIDRNATNNKIANLRVVDRTKNNRNRSVQYNNVLGTKGISRNGSGYQARLVVARKCVFNRTFRSFEAAVSARAEAERLFFAKDFA